MTKVRILDGGVWKIICDDLPSIAFVVATEYRSRGYKVRCSLA